MANEVKWIKLKVGMFDGVSFKKIKRAKIGGESFRDKLTAVWFELLDLGGKCNNSGALSTQEIAYKTYEDIAIMLDRETDEIELCMNFYLANNMVEILNDCYCLSNWCKYQNEEGLEKIREQTRLRVAKHRENQKLALENNTNNQCNVTCNATVTQPSIIDIELDNRYKNIDNKKVDNNIIDNNKEKNKNACTPEFISMLLRIVKDKLPEMEDSTYISLEVFLKTLSKTYSQKNIEVSLQHALLGVLENYSNIENTFGYLRNAIAINCEQFKEGSYQYDN